LKSKGPKALNKLKSLYYLLFVAMAASLLSGSDAFATIPSINNNGIYYGSTEIMKGNIPGLNNNIFQMIFSGDYQDFLELQNKYSSVGTIYYKLGENGSWSNEIPSLKSVGSHNIFYYIIGNENYNNLADAMQPEKVIVNIVNWGKKVQNNGITNYIDQTGKVSAQVDKQGVIWVKDQCEATNNWYGLDNSSGIFEIGSRFWVKWLDPESNFEEYQRYYCHLDEIHKQKAKQGKLRIFLTGVTKPDGTSEYTDFLTQVPYYIRVDSNWQKYSINNLFILQDVDRIINTEYGEVDFFEDNYGITDFPEPNGKYARLMLNSFSPMAMYAYCNCKKPSSCGSNNTKYSAENDIHGENYCYPTKSDNQKSNDVDQDYNYIKDIFDFENYFKRKIANYRNPIIIDISDGGVKFLILEEIISTLLLAALAYVLKILFNKSKNKK